MHFVNIAGLNLNRNKELHEIVEVNINGDFEMWSWVKNYVGSEQILIILITFFFNFFTAPLLIFNRIQAC